MSQSLVVTANHNPFMDGTSPLRLIFDWVSAADGTVSLAVASTFTTAEALKFASPPAPSKVRGLLKSVETIPGLNGDLTTTLPTALYQLTIIDTYGFDVLQGAGLGRSGTLAERLINPATEIIVDSELTLTITGAGDGLTGRIIMEFAEARD